MAPVWDPAGPSDVVLEQGTGWRVPARAPAGLKVSATEWSSFEAQANACQAEGAAKQRAGRRGLQKLLKAPPASLHLTGERLDAIWRSVLRGRRGAFTDPRAVVTSAIALGPRQARLSFSLREAAGLDADLAAGVDYVLSRWAELDPDALEALKDGRPLDGTAANDIHLEVEEERPPTFWEELGIEGLPEDWEQEQKEEVARAIFQKYDVDESGYINLEELCLMIVDIDRHVLVFKTPERVFSFANVQMQYADMNNDGYLSEEEFVPFFVDRVIINGFEMMKEFDFEAFEAGQ